MHQARDARHGEQVQKNVAEESQWIEVHKKLNLLTNQQASDIENVLFDSKPTYI